LSIHDIVETIISTQRKGDIAKAISTFTSYGFDVSLPITESGAYDIIVDANNILYRVEVKYSSKKKSILEEFIRIQRVM